MEKIFDVDVNSLNLTDLFSFIKDPRGLQGKLYPLKFLLNCAQGAILSGANGFRQIGEWIKAQSFEKLKKMGNIFRRKPDESTLRKCFLKLNICSFKRLCYFWSSQKIQLSKQNTSAIAVDGKTLRGSRNSDHRQPHILSAVTHESGVLIGDLLVPNKRSEVQFIQPLLDKIDISGKIITADALHTIKSFGQYLTARDADYIFIAKANKGKLIGRLQMLDIKSNCDSICQSIETSHGRKELRTVYLLSDLPFWLYFPSAEQAFIIERERINVKSGKIQKNCHFGLTSLLAKSADAKKILTTVRGHWTVENKAFHVRDRTMFEDQSTVRSKTLPEIMVVFRNLAMNLFRLNKENNIAKERCRCGLYPGEELKLMGIA